MLLKGARIYDPAQKLDKVLDIYIKDSKIEKMGKDLKIKCGQVIDLKGKVVLPGLIDMHVHLREPGFENRETIRTGALSASRGGLTAIACMPNTNPPLDNIGGIALYKQNGLTLPVEVYPIGCVSKERAGKELTEMGSLYEAGAVAFSDDGAPVASTELMRRALEYSKVTDTPIIDHCEDTNLKSDGVMNESYTSSLLGLKGNPAEAEVIHIYRNIVLSRLTGGKVHIAHLSTKDGLALIKQAKKDGINITCEVTINHLLLTEEDLADYDTNLKVSPPLRSKEDQKALLKGLADGTIDALVSDHAPWTYEDKEVEFSLAPFGISGIETLVPLAFGELYKNHNIPLARIVDALSHNPAKILNLPDRRIKKGSPANLTVLDLDAKDKISKEDFITMGKNTPYNGKTVNCKPFMTVVNGKAYKN
ncbi:MAG: dihydroorotase [Armatimonadota bacterium]